MSSVLVTGLRGFIGRYCVEQLHRLGYEIHGVTNRSMQSGVESVHWHQADLLVDDEVDSLVKRVRAKCLLHLAWIAEPPQFWTSDQNLEWLRASLRLSKSFAEAGGERIVVSGSCAEYEIPDSGPCIEDRTPVRPSSLYGASKAALQMVLRRYAEQAGLSLGWGRTFFVYGPGEPAQKLLSTLIRDMRAKRETAIREPNRRLDYIAVQDVARALVHLLHSDFRGAVNIGSGKATTAVEISNTIARLLGEPAPQTFPGGVTSHANSRDLYADTARLRDQLGFECRFTLERGIAEMLDPSEAASP